MDLNTGTGNPFGSDSDDEDTEAGQWGGVRGVSGYHVSRLSPVRAEEERRQDGSSRGGSPRRTVAQGMHRMWDVYIWRHLHVVIPLENFEQCLTVDKYI